MVPWLGASRLVAANNVSVTTWLVSTFPATTAAGYRGFSIDPSGTISLIGRKHPSFIGMTSSINVRTTYSDAARTIEDDTLKLSGSCSHVPLKSNVAERAFLS